MLASNKIRWAVLLLAAMGLLVACDRAAPAPPEQSGGETVREGVKPRAAEGETPKRQAGQ